MAKPAATKVVYIKKKGGGHGGHHGGAWKVAYADFVTAMMALFMVLWLVSQTDETTRASLSRYFRTGVFTGSGHVIGEGLPATNGPSPGGGGPRLSESERLEDARDAIHAAVAGLVGTSEHSDFDATVTEGGLLVRVSDESDGLAFDLSSSSLTPALRTFLERVAPILAELGNDLQIHGHTDARPFPAGSSNDNWNLSFARADAARRVLEASGVAPGRIVGVLAHGASAPLIPADPLDPRNRRLTILAVRRGDDHEVSHVEAPSPVDGAPAHEPVGPDDTAAPAAELAADAPFAAPDTAVGEAPAEVAVVEGPSPSHGE